MINVPALKELVYFACGGVAGKQIKKYSSAC